MSRYIEQKIYWDEVEAVKLKYRQLAREIEDGASISDLEHSVSKLGIFIEGLLGYHEGELVWREF